MADFLKLSQEAFEASTEYIETNWRSDWDYSLRAFRNEHASGSKYLSEEYKARSRLFPPHTRSIIRKNEAAGAVAMFSSMDVVHITPGNPDDVMSVASASCMKSLMEHRLTKTIPAYQIFLGGLQDAQTTGTVVSYQYWEFQKKNGKKVKDKPCIDLRPIENIRIDGGASWLDPVNTSPYFCDIIPMYVCDVKGLMESTDEKTGLKFKPFEDSVIMKARPDAMDKLRQARLGKTQDPHEEEHPIKDFDVVWVMRWCMRNSQGDDYCYYTLGTEEILVEAKPLGEVYFHGVRPYVMGCAILETHKPMKSGLPVLVRPLQQESADITNQRIDNVKFVLNKRWLVARGRQVDVQSLVRNVPGGVTLTTDPKTDVQESNWPDVTSSAFVEHDRIKSQLDDLAGNFSPSTKVANNAVNDTLGGSKMANQSAGLMTDYLLRTVVETWWEPVLRQISLLERYYEDDKVILRLCANKAGLFPRFGPEQLSEMIELYDCDINVSVAMGAGDPQARLQKFIFAIGTVIQLISQAPPGVNIKEVSKEIFAMAGYRDGERFISEQQDPRLLKAMQALQQMKAMLEGKQMELQATAHTEHAKLQSNERIKAAELQVDYGRIQGDLAIRQAELAVDEAKLELERLKLQIEAANAQQDGASASELARLKIEQEQQKLAGLALKLSADVEKASLELERTKAETTNESKIGEVADTVSTSMGSIVNQISAIRDGITQAQAVLGDIGTMKQDMQSLGAGLGLVAGAIQKKKAKGFKLKKPDGKKTTAIEVSYDDGSSEELAVN